ncbi:hypothetical protein Gohar_016368 [Gossypium harknessii]|uniref:Uncharacterized protein n=1 Tax=Gossypium harknessii TaxID=34285 RepID=A0A7J9G2M8_9ROSI|nr:hypothetical protein [Gossypium harknessii]
MSPEYAIQGRFSKKSDGSVLEFYCLRLLVEEKTQAFSTIRIILASWNMSGNYGTKVTFGA